MDVKAFLLSEFLCKVIFRYKGRVEILDGFLLFFGELLSFVEQRNRISKYVEAEDKTTYYLRDAQGNVISVHSHSGTSSNPLWLDEQYIYGSSRLGMQQPEYSLFKQNFHGRSYLIFRALCQSPYPNKLEYNVHIC